MYTKEEIEARIADYEKKYGEWSFDIPLLHGVWTRKNGKVPHTRLKRMVQIVSDLANKPLSECRILDLGCLDGIFSIEFAQHKAEVVGIEIREDNVKKAELSKDILNLTNLKFIQDDARNISLETLGSFDAIICSGLLYHLTAEDVFSLMDKMYRMTNKIVIIDTHISLQSQTTVTHNGVTYNGRPFREHSENASLQQQAARKWASWKNTTSFWFTRPSLINVMKNAGFTSVYECFVPIHLNFGQPGIEHPDRCTFVAIKGKSENTVTSPLADTLKENWPEESLSYSSNIKSNTSIENTSSGNNSILARIKRRFL